MILKELIEKRFVTISYYKDRSLQKCTGHIFVLNLDEQTIFLKDQYQKIVSIRLSRIIGIYYLPFLQIARMSKYMRLLHYEI